VDALANRQALHPTTEIMHDPARAQTDKQACEALCQTKDIDNMDVILRG